MSEQSAIQRFLKELRRRHVPQTAAVYLVAAWAAIEFSDVVVPNLNGPQWMVTAVIVAALVGFPVMLVTAWVFDWGPEGLHRTRPDQEVSEAGRSGRPTEPSPAAPWIAAVAVLVIGIATALAVAFVLTEAGGDGAGPDRGARPPSRRADGRRPPPAPEIPEELEILSPGFVDSIQSTIFRSLGQLDTMELRELREVGRRAAIDAGVTLLLATPPEWQPGPARRPVTLARGDTLVVQGVAYDSAGVGAVLIDGRLAAESEAVSSTLPFRVELVGTGAMGIRVVPIVVRLRGDEEIRREYQILQVPAGDP